LDLTAASITAGGGLRGTFLERRFRNDGQVDIEILCRNEEICFLSKSKHTDEYYRIDTTVAGLAPGLYRVRDEGAPTPLVTVKKQGDGRTAFSETIDIVHPDGSFLDRLLQHGRLTAVVEKTRVTYQSKSSPNSLLHVDEVDGMGAFYDLKGDTVEALDAFVSRLGLAEAPVISESYLQMRERLGISQTQLAVWQFHKKFQDYVLGLVSGTLTPLGFLSAMVASGGTRTMLVLSLLSAGLCDGLSDSVAASQTTQSEGKATLGDQVGAFLKTMSGKIAIPLTFLPVVLATSDPITTAVAASIWGATVLTGIATVQALAHSRRVLPAVAKLPSWGAAAVTAGTALGQFIPGLVARFFAG
jgi:adenylate cyclase class IV